MKRYFKIRELVCPHIYRKMGTEAWVYVDPRLQAVMVWLRETLARPVYVNRLSQGLTQRGVRCNLCSLVKAKTEAGECYLSAHIFGAACDFDVKGMTAQQVRLWIVEHEDEVPYPVRLEKDVTWVHLDVFNSTDRKVVLF